MTKHRITETILSSTPKTVRLGAGTGAAHNVDDKERGKAVKLVGESRFDLCAAGDPIEGIVTSVEVGTSDGYTIAGVASEGFKEVTFDGLEATPGTGAIAVGDYVVTGTVVAKGTALSGPLKVCKATNQPGTAVASTLAGADTAAAVKTVLDAALVKVADAEMNAVHAWRVVSLGSAGTGAVGTTGIIERVSL
jgi:hypothetical protein